VRPLSRGRLVELKNLPEFYDDPKWKLYDPKTGKINVTHSFDACFAAARPDVSPEYYDYCTQCEVDQVVTTPAATYFIPLQPVPSAKPSPLHEQPGAGVAMDGVRVKGPAPYDDIIKATWRRSIPAAVTSIRLTATTITS
jgi:hypothetical protein